MASRLRQRFERAQDARWVPPDVWSLARHPQGTVRSVSLIWSASLLGYLVGVVGSLVQARFITPSDLGFVRKYSVVAQFVGLLNLGLFTILQRDYTVLMGTGQSQRARRTASIVHSWSLLASTATCGVLSMLLGLHLVRGDWRESAAWLIQIVTVWSTLYVACLSSMFRSSQQFETLAIGQFMSSLSQAAVIPFFWAWPFAALVLRSISGQIVSLLYLHLARPIGVGWCLPSRELFGLAKRGMRLYVGTYMRYSLWLAAEIWLTLRITGDAGVGLFVFSGMVAELASQLVMAINQVYWPRLGYEFGRSHSITACLRLAAWPSLVSLGASLVTILGAWVLLPPLVSHVFPNYLGAIVLARILVLKTVVVSLSLPLYLISILEAYVTQLVAATVGLALFVGVTGLLWGLRFPQIAVAWGSVAGQAAFALTCLLWLAAQARRSPVAGQPAKAAAP